MTKIFTVGLSGVYDEAAEALTRCNTAEERDFVEAAIAGIKAIRHIGAKFAAEAKRRLETETDADTIRCLQKIAETADRVPWNPPQTFYEGVAALAFMRKAIGSIEGYGYNSMGRPDLLLAPLMEKDRAAGVSDAELYDLMCRFMLIWDCHVDHTKIMLGYSEYEYENAITIGGVDSDGNEVFNDVTKMFVESALELDLIYPKLMCRFGSASSDAYLNTIANVMLPAAKIDENRLVDFIRACAINHVEAIQINCVNRDELLAAQKEPEKYRHIIVRVTGFSCPFVMLSKEWQDEVLSRNYYD